MVPLRYPVEIVISRGLRRRRRIMPVKKTKRRVPNAAKTCRVAVVLAAGAPPAALRSIVGHTSSAMVPVNGRPTIHWLLHYLREIGISRVVLGLRHTETRLPRFVQ